MRAAAGLLRRQRLSVASLTAAALLLGALVCFLDVKVKKGLDVCCLDEAHWNQCS